MQWMFSAIPCTVHENDLLAAVEDRFAFVTHESVLFAFSTFTSGWRNVNVVGGIMNCFDVVLTYASRISSIRLKRLMTVFVYNDDSCVASLLHVIRVRYGGKLCP